MKRGFLILALAAFLPTLHAGTLPASTFFETAGTRAGTGYNRGSRVASFELFATSPAITEWAFSPLINGSLHVEGSMGFLTHDGNQAFTGRLGPLLDISIDDSPVHFILSSSVAYLSDHEYGNLNLGSELQFISGAGFDWEFYPNWILGYRWQHISNAGISQCNPGLNLNTISLGFRF